MKKNKILKEEIVRIHELMNVSPSKIKNSDFIIESVLLIESILPAIIKAGVDAADNIVNKATKTGKNVEPQIQRVIDELYKATDDVSKLNAIGKLMDISPEIFAKVSDEFSRVNKPQLDVVSTYINDILTNPPSGVSRDDLVDNLLKTSENTVDQLCSKIPSNKLRTQLKSRFKKEIENFDKYKNVQIPSPNLSSWANDFFTKSIPNLQTILRQVKNSFFKSFDSLQKRFFELEKIATAKMMAGNPATSEVKEMADILGSLNSKWGFDAETVWNSMTTEGKKGWKSAVSDFVEQQLEYKRNGKVWDGVLEALSLTDKELVDKWTAYKKMAKFWTQDGFARVATFALYRDPRLPAELMQVLAKKGMTNFVLWRAWYYFFVFPAIYAFISSIPDVLTSTGEAWDWYTEGERPEKTTYGDNGWFMTYLKRMGESFPGDGALGALAGFIQPTGIWDLISGIDTVMGGFQTKDIESLKIEAEQDYEDFKNSLSDEDRKKLEDSEREVGLGDESTDSGASEGIGTDDPVLIPLFSKYTCIKKGFENGTMKKVSDTELRLTAGGSVWTISIEGESAYYMAQDGESITKSEVKCK